MHTWTWTHPYCRCSKWPQLAATQAVKHLVKFTTDMVLWQLFADGLQSDFQLINCLGLWLQFMVLFQDGTPEVIPSGFKSRQFGGHCFFSMNPGKLKG